MNESKTFADGENVVIIHKEDGSKAETAIVMTSPFLLSFQLNSEARSPMMDVSLEYKLTTEGCERIYSEEGGLLKKITLDMFKGISVSQMFRIINEKIKDRNRREQM